MVFRGVRNSNLFFRPGLGDSVERNGNWIIQSNKVRVENFVNYN